MSITMNERDVSRESSPAGDIGGDVRDALARLESKIDELLEDSRAARPLLDRYLKTPAARWAGRAGRGANGGGRA